MNREEKPFYLTADEATFISEKLIDWYLLNKRDLPWRDTADPYKIWVSEIILQQTRIDQGLSYYLRFVERFPDVMSLALADEEEVLKYWQGLGYYSRARNLHAAARTILEQFNGIFPEEYADVLKLKGVGEYTAAAIVSFAWNKPYPSVDGNVFRFLSRLLAIGEPIDTGKGIKIFMEAAKLLMDDSKAGLFNQAAMEFGALQCVPFAPDCRNCPFGDKCLAYNASQVECYPVKQNKTKTQDRYLYYFHIHDGSSIYLKKRQDKGVWQNLYEFPSIESEVPLSFELLSETPFFRQLFPATDELEFKLVVSKKKHVLSHRIFYADFYEVFLKTGPELHFPFLKIKDEEISEYPIHRLMQLYLETHS